jgi:hypothetical protein
MKHTLLSWLLPLLCLALWASPARATTLPARGRSLAEALNPDGTLRPGAAGSFDARAFRMQTGPDGRPVFRPAGVAGTLGAGDEKWQDGFNLPDGTNGQVYAVVQAGNDTYVGGQFTIAGGAVASNVAKWNGTAWSSLGTGANNGTRGPVNALAVTSSGEVYVGGRFTAAGQVALTHIAKWNGTAWSSLGSGIGNGTSGDVNALALASNGDLYVAGLFYNAGALAVGHIAKWNGTAWSSLGGA